MPCRNSGGVDAEELKQSHTGENRFIQEVIYMRKNKSVSIVEKTVEQFGNDEKRLARELNGS